MWGIASDSPILSDATMSYFKIYPRKMMVEPAVEDAYPARLFFHLEQYGRLHRNQVCPVELRWDPAVSDHWRMVVTQSDIPLREFDRFIASLNAYLFTVLKYVPSGPRPETPLFPEEYFFQPVYFDAIDGDMQSFSPASNPSPAHP
jgi:hypothetical protein